jgi:hypothetical protein
MDNQRHRQHWVHITQNEDKQNKKHNTEKYKDEQHGPPQKNPPMVEHMCLRTSPWALPTFSVCNFITKPTVVSIFT